MRLLATLLLMGALAPLHLSAACLIEPLPPKLQAADVVYVGTVVRSELTQDLPPTAVAELPRNRRIELRHEIRPEVTLKGNPALVPFVYSSWQYNPPMSRSVVEFAELSQVMPGDTLLIVAHLSERTRLSLCTATRQWDAKTKRVVHEVFPPTP
jgi:hypothetical protein